MSEKDKKNLVERRREHNRDLIRRMRNGDSLKTVDSRASWFPPRPIIKKDPDAIRKLYKDGLPSTEEHSPELPTTETKVPKLIAKSFGKSGSFDEVS